MDPAEKLPTLECSRLRLRALTSDDVNSVFAIFSDAKAMRYWSHAPFEKLEQAEWYLRDAEAGRINDTHYQWGIALRDSDSVIGTTTLFALKQQHRRAEIGYALASAHWGKGYASEALTAVIGHAMANLGMNRLEADIDPRNTASCRLVEKLGFRHEGELRQRWYVAGEVQHSAIYGLLAHEFIAAH